MFAGKRDPVASIRGRIPPAAAGRATRRHALTRLPRRRSVEIRQLHVNERGRMQNVLVMALNCGHVALIDHLAASRTLITIFFRARARPSLSSFRSRVGSVHTGKAKIWKGRLQFNRSRDCSHARVLSDGRSIECAGRVHVDVEAVDEAGLRSMIGKGEPAELGRKRRRCLHLGFPKTVRSVTHLTADERTFAL
jgi:hypothetical protein